MITDYSEDRLINEIVHFRDFLEGQKIVMITGAGLSTAAGIRDFRGTNGEFKRPPILGFHREETWHTDFLKNYPDLFYQEHKARFKAHLNAKPTKGHYKLTQLFNNSGSKSRNFIGLITINIDGLHQASGFPEDKIIELHGSIRTGHCEKCGKTGFTLEYMVNSDKAPRCDEEMCDGIVRPDIILPGEQVDLDKFSEAVWMVRQSDCLFIIGTTMRMYPFAGLLDYYRARTICILNGEDMYPEIQLVSGWTHCRLPIQVILELL